MLQNIPTPIFTDRTRKVFHKARDLAEEGGYPAATPEDIAISLLREGEGVAAAVLTNQKVSFAALEADLAELRSLGESNPVMREVGWTSSAVRVLEQAGAEARAMGHYFVGTEHLLLALVNDSSSGAGELLARHGAHAREVRAEIIRLLSGSVA